MTSSVYSLSKTPLFETNLPINMFGVKIQDKKISNSGGSSLNFDLRDILAVIGEPVNNSRWRCIDLWYTASRNGRPSEIREARLKLAGEELTQLASNIHQTIDGRFEAKSEGATKKPCLVIVAFDSSWFEVWSSKPWVIKKLKEHFQMVSDIPISLGK